MFQIEVHDSCSASTAVYIGSAHMLSQRGLSCISLCVHCRHSLCETLYPSRFSHDHVWRSCVAVITGRCGDIFSAMSVCRVLSSLRTSSLAPLRMGQARLAPSPISALGMSKRAPIDAPMSC